MSRCSLNDTINATDAEPQLQIWEEAAHDIFGLIVSLAGIVFNGKFVQEEPLEQELLRLDSATVRALQVLAQTRWSLLYYSARRHRLTDERV